MSNGGKEKEWEDYRGRQDQKRERSRGGHCREGKHNNRSDERETSKRESRSRSRERCRKNPARTSDSRERPLTKQMLKLILEQTKQFNFK